LAQTPLNNVGITDYAKSIENVLLNTIATL
jgi:hypothetical protein